MVLLCLSLEVPKRQHMAATLGLNPSASLPLPHHFRLLPQSVTPDSIPVFYQLYWAAISNLGQVWPHSMEPIVSKLSCRGCNQGELPPSCIVG